MEYSTDVLLDDLCFGEGPRWHENRLWFSDMHDNKVKTVDLGGNMEVIVEVPNHPSGLGWTPDGKLLIVSMTDRRLLRLDADGLTEVADISHLATCHCNDMVVDNQGRAYLGNFGFDLWKREPPTTAEMIMVSPDGQAQVVADNLGFPNGTVITDDGTTLIVGESFARQLTAFDVNADGTLHNRRVWAELSGGAVPDGICLDAEMGIWVASPASSEALRIIEGGEVTDRVKVDHQAYACMLGGAERKTLFIMTSSTAEPAECIEERNARVEIAEVVIPGAGLP